MTRLAAIPPLHAALISAALLLGAASPYTAAARTAEAQPDEIHARESLRQCIDSRFAPDTSTPLDEAFDTEGECPGLREALAGLPGYRQLDPPLGDKTSLHQLLDVRDLLKPAPSADGAARAYDQSDLKQLARALKLDVADTQLDWWERFKIWIKEKLNNDGDGDWSWLSEWLEGMEVPAWVYDAGYYTSVSLIVLLALLVLWNELREWRGRRRGTRAQREGPRAEIESQYETPAKWSDIAALPAQAQIPALLRWLIARMTREGWLPPRQGLTNRELRRHLRREHAHAAGEFDTVVAGAEYLTYGDRALPEQQAETAREAARRLRQALREVSPAPAAASKAGRQ